MKEKKPTMMRLPIELWNKLRSYAYRNKISKNKAIVEILNNFFYDLDEKLLSDKKKK